MTARDPSSPLLAGLSPAQFMQRHWHKRPLLVRGACPGVRPPLAPRELFALAAHDDVESRLVVRDGGRWRVRRGPLPRRALPSLERAGWTLLVQGVDLHSDAAYALLQRFRFVPDARLDDLMVSYASDGGGVGPHVDSYDVFLLQVAGVRRWRVGRVRDTTLRDDVPLKMLARFEPEHEWHLEAGDLLYLPPGWGHDGEAAGGGCVTCSIGFRAPGRDELARELLLRVADALDDDGGPRYRDPRQPASDAPAAVPEALQGFARDALARALRTPQAVERALGEWLSEPKPQTTFDAGTAALPRGRGVRLDRRTRMVYDARHVYCNGEAWVVGGADARLLRALADRRMLRAPALAAASAAARALLERWAGDGWLHAANDEEGA
jgi:50S ribosomal protein L16 3-hydroxylase